MEPLTRSDLYDDGVYKSAARDKMSEPCSTAWQLSEKDTDWLRPQVGSILRILQRLEHQLVPEAKVASAASSGSMRPGSDCARPSAPNISACHGDACRPSWPPPALKRGASATSIASRGPTRCQSLGPDGSSSCLELAPASPRGSLQELPEEEQALPGQCGSADRQLEGSCMFASSMDVGKGAGGSAAGQSSNPHEMLAMSSLHSKASALSRGSERSRESCIGENARAKVEWRLAANPKGKTLSMAELDKVVTEVLMEGCGIWNSSAADSHISSCKAQQVVPAVPDSWGQSEGLDSLPSSASRFNRAFHFRKAKEKILPRAHSGTMDALRVAHENMLVERSANLTISEEPGSAAPLMLRPVAPLLLAAFAVLPLRAGKAYWVYGWAVIAGLAGALCYSVLLAAWEPELQYYHIVNVCLLLGALLGLVFLWAQHIADLLGPYNRPLGMHAIARGFDGKWAIASIWRLVVVVGLWAATMACRIYADTGVISTKRPLSPVSLVTFGVANAVLAALIYCHLHVCCGFGLAVDWYCERFFRGCDSSRAISEWNILQALLRRAAHTIENCVLTLGASILSVLLLTGLEFQKMSNSSSPLQTAGLTCKVSWASWVLPPTALMFFAVFEGAAITEKCSRVSSLVNSWIASDDQQIDHQRHFVVQYIVQSHAGFYIKGTRLRARGVWTLAYIAGGVLFSLLSQSSAYAPN